MSELDGIRAIEARVRTSNEGSIGLLLALGFELVEVRSMGCVSVRVYRVTFSKRWVGQDVERFYGLRANLFAICFLLISLFIFSLLIFEEVGNFQNALILFALSEIFINFLKCLDGFNPLT